MIYSISNGELTVSVNSFGSELWSICDKNNIEFLWQGDEKYWKKRSPVLFPFVGRLPDKKYTMDGKTYSLPIHGFAPGMEFNCVSLEKDKLVLQLTDTPETLEQYPRHFLFKTEYRLSGKKLYITYAVENRDEKTMYFGLGGHPGINIPLTSESSFEDWYLEFSEGNKPLKLQTSSRVLMTGEETEYPLVDGRRIPLRHDLFDNDALILRNMGPEVSLKSTKGGPGVKVSFPGMPYVGFWHMSKTDAPYVCVEPWCSLPADEEGETFFENKKDLITVPAGEKYENIWSIEIN